MTQDLFPNSDKVDVVLAGGEEITVPSGSVFSISIAHGTQSTISRIEIDGKIFFEADDGDAHTISADITLHENRTLRADSMPTDNHLAVTGWEFEYSE